MMKRKYYACSVGEPGKGYDDENLERIIKNSAFILNEDTIQKGVYDQINNGDILILKFKKKFIAYGEAIERIQTEDIEWNLWATVKEWFFFDKENYRLGIQIYGIQDGTIKGSGQMGTVKGLYEDFAIPKLKLINSNTELIKQLIVEQKNINNMDEIILLLKHKGQVILQGPPGTGKTYMAKKIAAEMTKTTSLGRAEDRIDSFFKTFVSSSDEVQTKRAEYAHLLQEFQLKFPPEELENLSLGNYAIGTGENDSFCWWIERGLKPLGYYFPGSSRSYLIYWNKNGGEYSTHFKHSATLKDAPNIDAAMKLLAHVLSDLVANKSGEAFAIFGNSLILKILHSYYPDEFFPINSVDYLDNVLKLLNIDCSNLSFIEKNRKVQEVFVEKKAAFKADVTNVEFMVFLSNTFDLKGKIVVREKDLIASGEYKLIQFHPAYTYEDFVRGIVAKPTKEGHVHYKVEDRILAQFARKAEENPSASFVLIIDEINRANLPSVLGELIYALEYRFDKEKPEETSVESMYAIDLENVENEDSKKLKLPGNLYIIGTMNTADRSVGHIDYAIRRRFAFVDVLPKIIPELTEKGKELFLKVAALFCEEFWDDKVNLKRSLHLAPDFSPTDVMPGHSYYLIQDKERTKLKLTDEEILKLKLEFEIKPILREYKKDGVLLESAGEIIESLYV